MGVTEERQHSFMTKSSKAILWLAAAAGVLALFFILVLIFIAPEIVNFESVKGRIIAEFSKATGGAVEIEKIDVRFFPRPSITFQNGKITVPEKISGTFSFLSIYPDIGFLLRGKARIARLSLVGPDVRASLPDDFGKMKGMDQFSLKAIDDELAAIVRQITDKEPGLVISVEKGSLTLLRMKESAFWFRDVEARITFPGDRLTMQVGSNSNVWKRFSMSVSIKPGELKGEGHLDAAQLRPDLITQNLFPHLTPRIEDTELSFSVNFGAEGEKSLHAEVQCGLPGATLRKGQQNLTLKKISLKGALRKDGDITRISLNELTSVYPQLAVSATMSSGTASEGAALELRGKEIDVESVRSTALFLGGHSHTVQSIFEIVRKGRIPVMTLTSHGRLLSDLAKEENIVIKGNMTGGNIVIDEPYLDLEDVTGSAMISRGILEAKDSEARLGSAHGSAGSLRIDLDSDPTLFHLEVFVKADVAHVPGFLKEVVEDKDFTQELDLIKEVRGDASGLLVLDRPKRETDVYVDVKNFSLRAEYERFPYPIEANGRFLYDDAKGRIMVENLSGRAGKSSFSRLTGEISIEKEPRLNVTSCAASILLDEIYPWLASFQSLQGLLKTVDSAKGTMKIDTVQMRGVMTKPESLQFHVEGGVQNATLSSPELHDPALLASGTFKAEPEQLSFSAIEVDYRDSSVKISGVLSHYLQGIDRAEVTVDGDIGEQTYLRVSDFINMPSQLKTRSPLSLSQEHVIWERDGKTSLSGNMRVHHGPELSIDVLSDRGELVIKRLVIKDGQSDASLSFHMKKREMDLSFKGTLTGTTLNQLLAKNEFVTGGLKGNLSAHIVFDQPFNSMAQGEMQGTGLRYPYGNNPVKIETLSLSAQGNRFIVGSEIVVWEQRVRTEGHVDFLQDGFVFDMNAFTAGLDLDRILAEAAGKSEKRSFWDVPLKGTLRVESDQVTWGKYRWSPVYANIIFAPEKISIGIMQADLCGVDTFGILDVFPNGVEVRAQPRAKDQDLRQTLACLSGTTEVTGRFSLSADISGKGEAESLLGALKGTIEFDAKKGRIDRYGLLAKIFEVLSPTGLVRIGDLRKQGFSYYTIKANGKLEDGKLSIKEALVDAPSVDLIFNGEINLVEKKIDAVVLVVPFRTLDKIIRFIPLVRYVMAGRLVAIPVRVRGNLENPDVTPFSPSAVGAGLLDTVKRFFELPLDVIQPLLPGEEKKSSP